MLRIDLSVLSRTELKRLLATADGRGQDTLVEQLRAELATRARGEGAGDGRGRASRTPPSPPVGFDDEPAPMAPPDDEAPDLWLDPGAGRARPARRWPAGLATAAVLVAGAAAAAWGLNGAPGLPVGDAAPPAAPPVAAVSPPAPAPRAMIARVEPLPPAPPETAQPPASPASRHMPPAPPEPARPTTLAKAQAPTPAPRRLDPCAAPPTPADRLLCNDLALNLLNHEMREAYGRAVDAGADPVAIRESQAAWRRARDPVSDPRTLARLYDRRIQELKALADESPRPDAAAATVDRQ